jgi:hypothetical protein
MRSSYFKQLCHLIAILYVELQVIENDIHNKLNFSELYDVRSLLNGILV